VKVRDSPGAEKRRVVVNQTRIKNVLQISSNRNSSVRYGRFAVERFAQIANDWNLQDIKEGGSLDRRLDEWRAKVTQMKEASEG